MAYKGPSGLVGVAEDKENYTLLAVLGRPEIGVYVHCEVFAYMAANKPTPEGDYLFYVEGCGRMRFQIAECE